MQVPKKILVVDDNPANRYVVEANLQELGVEAALVDGADAGRAELARATFDLVLMDVQMPGKDGYQATREIRADRGVSLPIVAMTANANIGERARCEAAGMNDLLVKPFDSATLVDVLNRHLSRAAAQRVESERVADSQPDAGSAEPLIDAGSPGSIIKRFTGRPATLRKLYSALQESIVMHVDAIRASRTQEDVSITAALHGLKGAAGMYGAKRLQFEATSIEARVLGGVAMADLSDELDQIERTGRATVNAVHQLLESPAGSADTADA